MLSVMNWLHSAASNCLFNKVKGLPRAAQAFILPICVP